MSETGKSYRMRLACFNCGRARGYNMFYAIEVDIPFGKTHWDTPCPHCGTLNLIQLERNPFNPYSGRRYRCI